MMLYGRCQYMKGKFYSLSRVGKASVAEFATMQAVSCSDTLPKNECSSKPTAIIQAVNEN